jgi:hypothetical protein
MMMALLLIVGSVWLGGAATLALALCAAARKIPATTQDLTRTHPHATEMEQTVEHAGGFVGAAELT